MSNPTAAALSEIGRLQSLNREAREAEQIYASDSDLRELAKNLNRKDAKPLAWRWVADFVSPRAHLYGLLVAVNKERE